MAIELGKFLLTAGFRKNSVSIGFQITKYSFDIDLLVVWFGVERLSWK